MLKKTAVTAALMCISTAASAGSGETWLKDDAKVAAQERAAIMKKQARTDFALCHHIVSDHWEGGVAGFTARVRAVQGRTPNECEMVKVYCNRYMKLQEQVDLPKYATMEDCAFNVDSPPDAISLFLDEQGWKMAVKYDKHADEVIRFQWEKDGNVIWWNGYYFWVDPNPAIGCKEGAKLGFALSVKYFTKFPYAAFLEWQQGCSTASAQAETHNDVSIVATSTSAIADIREFECKAAQPFKVYTCGGCSDFLEFDNETVVKLKVGPSAAMLALKKTVHRTVIDRNTLSEKREDSVFGGDYRGPFPVTTTSDGVISMPNASVFFTDFEAGAFNPKGSRLALRSRNYMGGVSKPIWHALQCEETVRVGTNRGAPASPQRGPSTPAGDTPRAETSKPAIALECIISDAKSPARIRTVLDYNTGSAEITNFTTGLHDKHRFSSDANEVVISDDGDRRTATIIDRRSLIMTVNLLLFDRIPVVETGQCTIVDANAGKPKF